MDNTKLLFLLMFGLLSCLGVYATKCESRFAVFILWLVMSLYAGFRDITVGIDTREYYAIFQASYNGTITYTKDKTFVIICRWLMRMLGKPEYIILLFSSIIALLFIIRMWELRNKYSFSTMLYVYLGLFYLNSMNITRQYIAVAIIFWATRFIQKNKHFIYVTCVIVATMFHLSAILGLVILLVYLALERTTNRRSKISLLTATLMVIGTGIFVFTKYFYKYQHYFISHGKDIGLLNLVILLCVLLIVLLSKPRHNTCFSIGNDGVVFKLSGVNTMCYMLGICISSIGYFFPYMDRIGLLFLAFGLMFWGQISKAIHNRYIYGIFLHAIVLYSLIDSVLSNGYGVFPYKTFFR